MRVLVLLLLLSISLRAAAQPTVVVLYDGLTLDDVNRVPVLAALSRRGAIGLMSTPTAGPKTDTAAMLTLALGHPAPAESIDNEAYETAEIVEGDPAGIVYARRTGKPIPAVSALHPGRGLVHLGIASLCRRELNERTIGAILDRAGLAGALEVVGNADTDRPGRRVALFAIDSEGRAPAGMLSGSSTLRPDPEAPFGVRDSETTLLHASQIVGARVACVVVHLGDGARLEAARPALNREAFARQRRRALAELDRQITRLMERLAGKSVRVLVVSPRPPAGAGGRWDRLTPVFLTGPGIPQGLLTSATTRTPGLIANVDIAPTLLQWMGVAVPSTMVGHAMEARPASTSQRAIQRLDRAVVVNDRGIYPVFLGLGLIASILVFGSLYALSRGRRLPQAVPYAMLALSNMPLAMLLVVLFRPPSVSLYAVILAALMAALAILEETLTRRRGALDSAPVLLSGATWIAITLDTLAGQPLIKLSLMSSYQLAGIRFYGMGNEYMGVFIGVTLLCAFALRMRPLVAALYFGVSAFLLGWPGLGANAGGLVAAVTAFGIGWLILRGGRARCESAAGFALAGFAVALLFAFGERLIAPKSSSHLGASLTAVGDSGVAHLWRIVERKAQMNLRILANPLMLLAMGAIAGVVIMAGATLRERLYTLAARQSGWHRALPAAGWGALAAFLFNDSGIVAAVFLIGPFLAAGLYWLFLAGAARDIGQSADAAELNPQPE